MNSMTGFGRASLKLLNHNVSIEISSVNKRILEFAFNTPKEWQSFEHTVSSLLRNKVERGRIRVSILVEQQTIDPIEKSLCYDKQLLNELDNLEKFVKERKGKFVLSPELIVQIAMLSEKENVSLPNIQDHDEKLCIALEQAFDAMVEMREKEGKQIFFDIIQRIQRIREFLHKMQNETIAMSEDYEKKLLNRLKKSNLFIQSDDERVLKEIALFAEKCDVSEELTRLESHLKQLEETCSKNGSIGRKLEFLLQEIARELNTFCSKSIQTSSTSLALEARVEVEKIKEQIMNVE